MIVCAVWSTTGLEIVGAGVGLEPALGAGVGFAPKLKTPARKREGIRKNRVRIIGGYALNLAAQKTSGFCDRVPARGAERAAICFNVAHPETFGSARCCSVRPIMFRFIDRFLLIASCVALAACATGRVGIGTKDTSKTFHTVVVDAGHGAKDNGAYRRFADAEI